MPLKILILGGTREAVHMAEELHKQGHSVTTSLAGRTKEPRPVTGEMRVGGFGGVEGLTSYIEQNKIDKLIDMTHPFALQISENANRAARLTNVDFEQIQRPPWSPVSGDRWQVVADLQTARDAIPKNAMVLLALGSQYLTAFIEREDVHFLIRMIDQPAHAPPFKKHKLLLGKPATDWQAEAEMLQRENITHIICRNSGGKGAYAKIEAARHLGLPVIMVDRA